MIPEAVGDWTIVGVSVAAVIAMWKVLNVNSMRLAKVEGEVSDLQKSVNRILETRYDSGDAEKDRELNLMQLRQILAEKGIN